MSRKGPSFFRNNGLSVVVLGLFFILLLGQIIAGYCVNNRAQSLHGHNSLGVVHYLKSPHFLEALFENWESEFLQMSAYVVLTVFLFQKGSSESKDPDKPEATDEDPLDHRNDPDAPGPVLRGGWQLRVYEHSLSLVLFGLFLISWLGHAFAGLALFNEDLSEHGEPTLSMMNYLAGSQFWFESFQNWQSEFLAVGAIVILSIWFRERGSPESKPVASPHYRTGK